MNKKVYRHNLMRMLPKEFQVFSFLNHVEDEEKILKPALEKLGYTNITFADGDKGARIATMTNRYGQQVQAIYG